MSNNRKRYQAGVSRSIPGVIRVVNPVQASGLPVVKQIHAFCGGEVHGEKKRAAVAAPG